jgi:polyisoprenoid-binding protein YceI
MRPHPATPPPTDAAIASAGTWHVDATTSRVEFAVKHIMVATVTGRFTAFEGTLEVSDGGVAKATGTITVASIDTDEPKRDAHLRSPDFFDVERYPTISFVSSAIRHREANRFLIVGSLTIGGVTREIELEAIVGGAGRDAYGDECTTLKLRGEIEQSEFGVGRQALKASRVLLGDKVKIVAEIAAVKAEPARLAA